MSASAIAMTNSKRLHLLLKRLFLHDPTRRNPSPGSADMRWPAATAADPEQESWPSTSINFAGSEACRALRKAKVYRQQCFKGRKWLPKSVPGIPKSLLAALRRTLVEPWPSQPLGNRRGVCGLQRIAHPPAGTPGAATSSSVPQPSPPQALENRSSTLLLVPGALSLHDPTRSTGSADTRWPAATAADPGKKSWPSTSINFAGSEACRALRSAKVGRK